MRKPTKFEIAYDALARIGSDPLTEESIAELKRAINSATSLLVSKAAEIAGTRDLQELIPDMVSAFDRLLVDGAKVDKQCNAKIAIANALNKIGHLGATVFLTGAYYIQMEPVYGGSVDTAAELRCISAYGLARIGHPDAHYTLADLLVDQEHTVRTAAVKALTYIGSSESELLLRLKVLTGDKEPNVLTECFAGLMAMAPDRSLEFVARYLKSSDSSLAECAALAIGESRIPKAYHTLRGYWDEEPSAAVRRRILLPIALLRSSESFDFLLEVVQTADSNTAAQAVSVLELYADDESIRRTKEVISMRGDTEIIEHLN